MDINRNSSGKVLVIFLVIFVILSLSLAGLAMFFLSKEKERRISTETALQQSVASATKLEAKLQDAIKQGFLLQEKNKEADEKINGLLDELELQEGIREELKKENQALKEKFEKETKAKAELQEKLASNAEAAQRLPELEAQLQTEQGARQELEQKLSAAEERAKTLEEALAKMQQQGVESPAPVPVEAAPEAEEPQQQETPVIEEESFENKEEIQLEKIVVAPAKAAPEGRVVMVDTETEFVIVNLGANHGIKEEQVLAVSRGKDQLGEIKVTRVQPEMSAADFIPPLTSRQIRKDDSVVIK
jgi:DNA repair exonuclease SbcCD ATPase subunit